MRTNRLLSTLLCLIAAITQAQNTTPDAPKLSKDVKKLLDKDGRDALKHCEEQPSKDQGLVARRCLDLGMILRIAKEPVEERVALKRSCALGNWVGCNEFGIDYDASGDHAEALKVWQNATCMSQEGCQISLVNSLRNSQPVDRGLLRRVGEPLCVNGNDSVCGALARAGIPLDYSAIAYRNRANKVQSLITTIQNADHTAQMWETQARSSEQQQAANGTNNTVMGAIAAVASAGMVSGMKIKAQTERTKAESARSGLQYLQANPVVVPQMASADQNTTSSAAGSNGGSGGSCPKSLSYLSSQLPSCYPGSELERIRQVALGSDIQDAVRKARAQGLSVSQAVNLANQQADQAHAALPGLEDGIMKASNNGFESMRALKAHEWSSRSGSKNGDVLTSQMDMWVALTIQETVNQEAGSAHGAVCRWHALVDNSPDTRAELGV